MGMMNLIYLACLSVVLAAPPQQPPVYPTPGPAQEYNPDIGQTNVGGYGVNKDPYCHMVEKGCSRISVSLTPRGLATPRIRSLAFPGCSTTVLELSRPRSSGFVLTGTSLSAIWWRPYTTRHSRRPTRSRGASQGRTECATPPTRTTTSAPMSRPPTATWRRRLSTM